VSSEWNWICEPSPPSFDTILATIGSSNRPSYDAYRFPASAAGRSMPELFRVQIADAEPWRSAATATSFGTSWSVVEKDMALSDGVTAKLASPEATCLAGVKAGDCGAASGLRSSTSSPARAYIPWAAAT